MGEQLQQRRGGDAPLAEQLVGSEAPTQCACGQVDGCRPALEETWLQVTTHSLGHSLHEETALDEGDAEQEPGWFSDSVRPGAGSRGSLSSHCPVPELNWQHEDPVPSVSLCYTLACSVEAHTTQTPSTRGHHVHPWAPKGAQCFCQALPIGHVPCPTLLDVGNLWW